VPICAPFLRPSAGLLNQRSKRPTLEKYQRPTYTRNWVSTSLNTTKPIAEASRKDDGGEEQAEYGIGGQIVKSRYCHALSDVSEAMPLDKRKQPKRWTVWLARTTLPLRKG